MTAYFLVSFLASVAGAICGIGGGVIIKPVLDLLHLESVSTISFLSGCTVLSMSCYSVGKAMLAGEKQVNLKTGTPMALGAALGGVAGKQMFSAIKALFSDQNMVGAIQAVCLAVITLATLIYTIKKDSIQSKRIENMAVCLLIGFILGVISSFLGIGGGPINLVALYYVFSMDTKTAAANSLYIILISQITSLLTTIVTGTIPPFAISTLMLMVAGGIGGGAVGRMCNRRMDEEAVNKLFIGLMVVIIMISIFNAVRYFGA